MIANHKSLHILLISSQAALAAHILHTGKPTEHTGTIESLNAVAQTWPQTSVLQEPHEWDLHATVQLKWE